MSQYGRRQENETMRSMLRPQRSSLAISTGPSQEDKRRDKGGKGGQNRGQGEN